MNTSEIDKEVPAQERRAHVSLFSARKTRGFPEKN
jgi:hypothetical protein